ncbi:sensor histidine kinase [Amycolatopsis dendrobii]|uniref:histidine kinase n=1 Tax=Amycolatopsis dendrobii TaxID=2760662 RepID=A0A7W3W0Q5_9PSEU|nr:sensor histidine kinase [Amycolatopsis dendrobii]MBB1156544.1 sensor domain-containing protein [Amycolatopsis dendrobii]
MEPARANRFSVRGHLAGFGVSFRYLAVGAAVGLGGLLLFWLTAGSLLLSVLGIGLPLLVLLVPLLRRFASAQRKRVGRLLGTPVEEKYAAPGSPLGVLKDRAVWKDLAFLTVNTVAGAPLCFVGLSLLSGMLCWGTAPIWWTFLPPAAHLTFQPVTSWAQAFGATGIGLGYATGLVLLVPLLARGHAMLARALLRPPRGSRQTRRIEELTVSRAEALEAHGAELRRIERDLHDGTQAGLVAISLRLGLIKHALRNQPDNALSLVDDAQELTEHSLAALRTIVRGIYPPLLTDRGLAGAVQALASSSAVPVEVEVSGEGQAPAAVEAAAYFVVAEALTNIAKHSGADRAWITLALDRERIGITVRDNGKGGAAENFGTGLAGIRRRVAAFDGDFALDSPEGGPTVLRAGLPCAS